MQEMGALSATGVDEIPFSGPSQDTLFEIEGRPEVASSADTDTSSFPHLNINFLLPDYFETMEMRLLRGRFLAETDREDASPAGVINDTLARRFFPGEDPTGKRVRIYFGEERKSPWIEIVGTVADGKLVSLDETPKPQMFLPSTQSPKLFGNPNYIYRVMSVLVRFDPASFPTAERFREVMKDLDPLLAVLGVEPMDAIVSRTLARPRFNLTVLGVFAIAAFLLAVVGIYGLVSYSVTQRTREIGIRMALGAQRGSILKLIVGQGSFLALIGVGIGLAVSLALTRVIGSLLYGVTTTDPLTFMTVTLLLTGIAARASFIPARRAARVDPQLALRVE
jgi:putative ABC transport system permease protein